MLAGVEGFAAVGLSELDARAALQHRIDRKYLVPADALAPVLEALRADHEALEIDGRRVFGYESVYFDTPGLESFHAHVEDRTPRYKARTRLYADSGECSFEVKVKLGERETVKASRPHDPDERRRVTPAARALLESVLEEHLGSCPAELAPSLVTRFRRSTLAHAGAPERLTIDVDLELLRPDGERAVLRDRCAILETKTRDGDGRCDALMRDAGHRPVSLSKYRTGIGLLAAHDADPPSPDPRALFRVE